MRAFQMFPALALLAGLILLAPQGLLTKPAYSEGRLAHVRMAYRPIAEGETSEMVHEEIRAEYANLGVEVGLPVILQPSLAAARGEEGYALCAGFLMASEPLLHIGQALGLQVVDVADVAYLQAEFPYRGGFSLPLGNWKLNERLRKRARERGYPGEEVVVVLDREGETIRYWALGVGIWGD